MANISAAVSETALDRIDAYCAAHRVSRSEAIRQALELWFATNPEDTDPVRGFFIPEGVKTVRDTIREWGRKNLRAGGPTQAQMLYSFFVQWCSRRGYPVCSLQEFGRVLSESDKIERVRRSQGIFYRVEVKARGTSAQRSAQGEQESPADPTPASG